jgi:RNA polymerase sigma factor (TIGR02999 family)
METPAPISAETLLPLVYEELRSIAAHKMAREAPGHTLQPTALVHEAWLRLTGPDGNPVFQNRAHFFGAAGEAMRRILIERARRRQALKHAGGWQRVPAEALESIAHPETDEQILALGEALDKLALQHETAAELVKLRYFVGLTNEETAAILGIAPRSAKYLWTYARAWLYRETRRNFCSAGDSAER